MCTDIAEKVAVAGSGKGKQGWGAVDAAYVEYDHPVHACYEHTLNLGFVNEAQGGPRIAVELERESARELATKILAALERAESYERA